MGSPAIGDRPECEVAIGLAARIMKTLVLAWLLFGHAAFADSDAPGVIVSEVQERAFPLTIEALGTARLAGIMAAKETSRLIPLCHPVALSSVEVKLEASGADAIEIFAEASCTAQTGVEMEAMCAASVAALTLYDMCKALHRGIRIGPVELIYKSGGRSGVWRREDGV